MSTLELSEVQGRAWDDVDVRFNKLLMIPFKAKKILSTKEPLRETPGVIDSVDILIRTACRTSLEESFTLARCHELKQCIRNTFQI